MRWPTRRRTGQQPAILYAAAVSKRPRPADPHQPDLFAPPDPRETLPTPAAPPRPRLPRARRARPGPTGDDPATPAPSQVGPASGPPGTESVPITATCAEQPDAAPDAAALETDRPADPSPAVVRPQARPEFRRIDPLGLRAADRPDSYLYCVLIRDAADAVLRDGLPDENPPALMERGAVPRQLAAAAEELGWSDEQPGAIAVLRVRRGEIAPADATPGARLRRAG